VTNNYAKLNFQKNSNLAAINRTKEAILTLGKSLPCRVIAVDGALVEVAFEVDSSPWTLPTVIIPKTESEWAKVPTQVGDIGITIPADTYIGNITGQGAGLPSIQVKPCNLSALVFQPVSNKNSPSPYPNSYFVQGPEGFVAQTQDGTVQFILNASGVNVVIGGITVFSIGSTGATANGNLLVNGMITGTTDVIGNGISLSTHTHSGVTTGGGDTGPPT